MSITVSKIVLAIQLLVSMVAGGGPLATAKRIDITNITPSSGRVGETISISGSGFELSRTENRVIFTGKNGKSIATPAVAASANLLTTVVPSGAASGRVYVQVGTVKSNAMRFELAITNRAPMVNAGSDQSLALSATGTVGTVVTGTVSDDRLPTGSTLTLGWRLRSGPAPVSFGSPTSASTTAAFPTAGAYTLSLTVSDTEFTSGDDVVIVVQDAPTPAPTPVPTPVPTVSLSANPTTITKGESVTLTWSSKDATSCTASGAWSGPKEVAGTATLSPETSGTYTLTCFSSGVDSAVQAATVTVNRVTTYDFSLNISGPTHVAQGHSLYLALGLDLLAGTRDYVNFSVAGLPAGATASFPDLEATCCGPTKAWEPGPTSLRIATTDAAAVGSFPVTVSATSGGVTKTATYLINIDTAPTPPAVSPVSATALLTIPSHSQWASNMTVHGQKHCAALKDTRLPMDQRLGATYYDAERVYYQIAAYTGSSIWGDCVQAAEQVYRDGFVMPNNGGVPGYWNFSTGLRRDYEVTGDTTSWNGALMLSQRAAFAGPAPIHSVVSAALSREVSYAIVSFIDAEKIGHPRNPKLDAYIDVLLGHFDQWFVSKNYRCPDDSYCTTGAKGHYYIQPFMVGLGTEALIKYYEEINHDPRIPAAVKIAADWLWAHAWYEPNKAFWYDNFTSDPSLIGTGYWTAPAGGAPDLNLLIAPAYAWLFRKTGDTAYRDQGDQIFVGGVAGAWLEGAKQFNQSYKWSFDFVKWRSGN